MQYLAIIAVNTHEAEKGNPITYECKTHKVYSFLIEMKVQPRCVVQSTVREDNQEICF